MKDLPRFPPSRGWFPPPFTGEVDRAQRGPEGARAARPLSQSAAPPDSSPASGGANRSRGRGGVLALAAFVLCLAFATPAAAQTDPAGPACLGWQSQWRAEGASMSRAQAEAFLARVPNQCAGTEASVRARIAALAPAGPAPPNPCAGAEARWTGGLRSSNDRAALQSFINSTPASCAIREAAVQRLAGLPAAVVTRPPPVVVQNPCDAADTTWASLRNSSDVARLERFVRDTPASCNARGQANARLAELQRPQTPQGEFDDCSGAGWCPTMVSIPAGAFTMGSPDGETGRSSDEGPQRRVSVAAFAAGKYEITRGQWAAFVSATGRADGSCSWRSPGFAQQDNHPVVCVSHEDAQAYAGWLSQRTGRTYRLLSEAEWEYAARGGDRAGAYWWGASASHEYANYGADTCCSGLASGRDQWVNTSPAGSFPANPFGLHDMHGNVWEWVEECYRATYDATRDCSYRADRGGGWSNDPQNLRSANRSRGTPASRLNDLGFRVARTPHRQSRRDHGRAGRAPGVQGRS